MHLLLLFKLMRYVNAWLKKNIFYLDLNRESVSEPRTLSEGYAILQFKESCLLFEYVKIAMY